jgi:hypothetical protein
MPPDPPLPPTAPGAPDAPRWFLFDGDELAPIGTKSTSPLRVERRRIVRL